MDVDHEIHLLVACLKRISKPNEAGKLAVTFGEIFRDEVWDTGMREAAARHRQPWPVWPVASVGA